MVWLVIVASLVLLAVLVVFVLLLTGSSKNDYQIPRGDDDIKTRQNAIAESPRPVFDAQLAAPVSTKPERAQPVNAEPQRAAPVNAEPQRAAPVRAEPQAAVDIRHAAVGDWLRISDAGEFAGDLEFRVEGKTRYESDQEIWYEYNGQCRGRTVCVEIFSAGNDDIGVVFPSRPITLEDLNLTEDDLIRFDEGTVAANRVMCGGSTWEFTWSGEVRCSGEGNSQDGAYYGWDFIEQGGQRILCVEKREAEPFEVCMVLMIGMDRARVTRR